jgi:hypothetical protein
VFSARSDSTNARTAGVISPSSSCGMCNIRLIHAVSQFSSISQRAISNFDRLQETCM